MKTWTIRPEYKIDTATRARIRRTMDYLNASDDKLERMREEDKAPHAALPLKEKEVGDLYHKLLGRYESTGRGAYAPPFWKQFRDQYPGERPKPRAHHCRIVVLSWAAGFNDNDGMPAEAAAAFFYSELTAMRCSALLCAEMFARP
jgi:hypothetical protein